MDGCERRIAFQEDDNDTSSLLQSKFFSINAQSMLKEYKIGDQFVFTDEQVNKMSELKIGDTNQIFNNSNKGFISEFLMYYTQLIMSGMDKKSIFPAILQFLERKWVSIDELHFSLPTYDIAKQKLTLFSDLMRRKIKIAEGIFKCRRKDCLSESTSTRRQQARRADEPENVIVTCNHCNSRFII